jgi:hypothetical protein
MTTTYTNQSTTGTIRASAGITGQTLNTMCHYAGGITDNSINLDNYLDLDMQIALALTPVAGAPINTYILYNVNGSTYEDGVPGTNDGTAAAAVVPNPNALIDSHGSLASTGLQHWIIKDVPALPYPYRVEVYNGTTKNASGILLSVGVYGRKDTFVG